MKYVFDIDGVICTNTNGLYRKAEPIPKHIRQINILFDNGNFITLHTARGGTTGYTWTDVTKAQLKKWGVKYHKLVMNKPEGDVYIDDKGMNSNDFFEK